MSFFQWVKKGYVQACWWVEKLSKAAAKNRHGRQGNWVSNHALLSFAKLCCQCWAACALLLRLGCLSLAAKQLSLLFQHSKIHGEKSDVVGKEISLGHTLLQFWNHAVFQTLHFGKPLEIMERRATFRLTTIFGNVTTLSKLLFALKVTENSQLTISRRALFLR